MIVFHGSTGNQFTMLRGFESYQKALGEDAKSTML